MKIDEVGFPTEVVARMAECEGGCGVARHPKIWWIGGEASECPVGFAVGVAEEHEHTSMCDECREIAQKYHEHFPKECADCSDLVEEAERIGRIPEAEDE